jgi:predicted aspartyl protease
MLRTALLCLIASFPAIAAAECQMNRIGDFKVQIERNQITVPGAVNGRPMRFLVDVGSPGTMLTAPAAQFLGLVVTDVNRNVTSSVGRTSALIGYATIDEMKADRFVIKGQRVTVRNQRDNYGAPDLVGILGNDFLGQYDIDIDLRHRLVTFFKPQGCGEAQVVPWSGAYSVLALKPGTRKVEFTARVNDHDVAAILDSGSPFTALTDQAAAGLGISVTGAESETAETAGATDFFTLTYDPVNGFAVNTRAANISVDGEIADPAGSGSKRSWLVKVASVELDQETVKPARLRVTRYTQPPETGQRLAARTAFAEDMVLGVDFLLSHHVLIARSQNKLYFTYAGGPPFQAVGLEN